MVQTLKKSDGTILPDLLVAQAPGSQYILQFAAQGHTCEDLRTSLSTGADTLTINTDGTDGDPISGYSVFVSAQLMPAATTGNPEDRIYVAMRQPTATERLQAAVAAGTITAEQYKAITGEDYAPSGTGGT